MEEIRELLAITKKLKDKYLHLNKNFSLDGKLVGDIGEVLAAEEYGLKLYAENTTIHDGEEIATGRKVQIKSSFKNNSYFPCGHVPDYFLSINILETGEIVELFNGPGQYIVDHYIIPNKLKHYNNTWYTLAPGVLSKLNKDVPESEKINRIENKNRIDQVVTG